MGGQINISHLETKTDNPADDGGAILFTTGGNTCDWGAWNYHLQ